MNCNCLPANQRKCPHCGEEELAYYRESSSVDLYYCRKCYRLIEWNGQKIIVINGEAYPDRDKSSSTTQKR
jgi:late competence protein required for DNA uptake (superfamily II DNA/RNA helicase)